MRRWLRGWRGDRRGVTTLEFTLLAIPLLLLCLGPIEFGRMLWIQEAIQMAAQQGARCIGILASSCASGGTYNAGDATSYVIAMAADWKVGLSADQITVTNDATSGACNGLSEVSISYTFQTAIPGLLTMLRDAPTLTGFACFPNQT